MQWAFQARSTEKFESTPLVVDGVMYLTQAPNDVVALDAATGEIKWLYSYPVSRDARPCCGRVNRGVAILGSTLYMATIDAHLVALDARDGKVLWDIEVAKATAGYAMTHAPLIVKDKVIVGTAGGEFGIRGFIAAYNASTGKEMWKFYTIPGPGEPGNESWGGDSWMHGGASVWVTGSYDPELNLTYWGIGNPGPDWNGDKRPGDNLYSDCVVALDADTGKLKWYFQFTPHDDFDYDAVQVPVLADINWPGRDGRSQPRKVMLWGNRNGFFYTLDRTTGQFLVGKPFVKGDLGEGARRGRTSDARERRRTVGRRNQHLPQPDGRNELVVAVVQPAHGTVLRFGLGQRAWDFPKGGWRFEEGKRYVGGAVDPTRVGVRGPQVTKKSDEDGYGAVRAIDPKTGERKWEFKMDDVSASGILTTASDLLFTGGREGFFHALDARTGKLLWKVAAGGEIAMGPMTYQVNGKQYVAFAAGSSLFTFALK